MFLLTIAIAGKKQSYKKKQKRPPSKNMKRGKNRSPRNMKACHNLVAIAGGSAYNKERKARMTFH
jgi:hypothetical protein